MKELWTREGKDLHLRLHEGQARAWLSERRFVFMLAGTQGGKTSFGPWWLHREIVNNGTGDYLAVTSSFDLFKLKMLPEIRTVFEHVLDCGRYWSGDKVLELKDPSTGKYWAERSDDPMWGRVILRSAQSKGGLESATGKAAWLDECGQDDFRLDDWEAIQRRLSLSQGRVLGTTTIYNLGWMKHEIYDAWVAGDKDIDVIQFASIINPMFPPEEFRRMQDKLPGWKFKMFYKGEYDRPPGLILADFDRTTQAVKPFPIPIEWPRYVGMDFGPVNTALIWIAEDTRREAYYLYRESLAGNKTTREHASDAKAYAKDERVLAWWGGSGSEDQYRRDWGEWGIPITRPLISDVESGLDRLIAVIKAKRFFVFDTCQGWLDEAGTYSREIVDGEVTEKIKDKQKFHRLDATRYWAASLPRDIEGSMFSWV